ncbi:DUF4097 family beta strand repeat-containing protein [Cytobacillus sp. Hz8]|uniref:DUF4097 family beta strand repeat-containing protein n=1 Tax=Cytobacillus sp. Hz8 TaxID=3347168 RepID=UPI0035DECF4E
MKEEKKRILNMVEEGKITVDEALTLLEELEKSNKTMEEKQKEIIGELSTVVHSEENHKNQRTDNSYKTQSVKDKIFDFIDSAFKKVKELDLDFNFGSSVDLSHIFYQADVNLQTVDIDIANGKVKVIPWDQKDVRIECQAKVYRVEGQEEARDIFLKNVLFSIEDERLRFLTEAKWIKLDAKIFIPKSLYHRLKIRMFNGPIETENLQVDDFNVKTANGKILIEGITSHRVEAETANGPIFINRGAIDKLEAETINGAVKFDGTVQQAEIQAFNGNIVCSVNDDSCKEMDVKATTGSIDLYFPDQLALQGILKTNLGSFKVDLEGSQVLEEKSEMVQKLLRFKPIVESTSITSIAADTKTGTISIRKVK